MINLLNDPISFIFSAIAVIVAITIHEFAHAFTADKLGDPTPKIQDRLTLNPIAHLDPIGTLALFIFRFGWGKPVQYDPYNLQNPKRDSLLIALAGPVSNLILAIILSIILKTFPLPSIFSGLIASTIVMNIGLAIFNLLPIPPLDGSKVLIGLLPNQHSFKLEMAYQNYQQFLLIFFILPLFGGYSLASLIISPIISAIINTLL
jgi:Zn-dependent protease